MIRMIQSQSAKQAKAYFSDALSKSDYYLNDQELPGTFHGRIAKRMRLDPVATKEAFQLLCDNRHPKTGKSLTPRTRKERRVGYDINFHAPKSLSVLHVLSKDDHLLNAFQESVRDTMHHIEHDSKTRIRKNKQDGNRDTGNLLWAEFIHQTARPVKKMAPDPHLHAHCFVFNATCDKVEKCYKAGEFGDIKRDMPYYQAVFHKLLSDRLIKLGYQIERTKTSFEVVGVPKNVIGLFSKRTNEIGQLAKDYNITDAKELDALGARSRSKKQKGLTLADLKTEWRRQIHEMGMTENGSDQPIRFAPKPSQDTTQAVDCIRHTLDHHFERVSVMPERRLLETAYRFSLGKDQVQVSDINDAFQADRDILKIKDGHKIVCTTKEALAEEKNMVALAQNGKGTFSPLYPTAPVLSLKGEQHDAVRHVLTTTNLVSIIRGRAGTGKTTLMKEAVAKIEATGKQVFVVAPTAQASRGVLRDEGFHDAQTVAALLASPKLQKQLKGQVLWVDEAGLLGTKDMTALLRIATQQKARLILSGDTRQHASVVRGDALRILNTVAGVKAAEVNRIFRQKPDDYRQAVEYLSQGKVAQAFSKLSYMDAIREVKPQKLEAALADDYMAALRVGRSALAVSPTHEQGCAVTAAIRTRMKKAKMLKGHEKTYQRLVNCNLTDAEKRDARHYEVGMVVQFNLPQTGIKRGSRWDVADIKGNTLILKDGANKEMDFCLEKRKMGFDVFKPMELRLAVGDKLVVTRNGADKHDRRLNNGQTMTVAGFDKDGTIRARNDHSKATYALPGDYGHINHAYCMTSHASQGKTVDAVFIAQPGATFAASDMKQFYVSVSRGREAVRIYTDDKTALLDQVKHDGDRTSAIELEMIALQQRRHQHLNELNSVSLQPKQPQPQKVRNNGFRPS